MESKQKDCTNYLTITKINSMIYMGSHEHPYNLTDEFEKIGINVIINCAKEITHPDATSIKYEIFDFPIMDKDYISFLENIDGANDTIHKCLSNNKKIYIHSDKGNSRAPAVLVYYLMSHKKFTYDKAVNLLTALRPSIDIDQEFEDQLRTIEEF